MTINYQIQGTEVLTHVSDYLFIQGRRQNATVKNLYTDNLYNSKIHNNVGSGCTNVPVQLEFEFITIEIQLNVKLFGTNTVVVKRVDCIYSYAHKRITLVMNSDFHYQNGDFSFRKEFAPSGSKFFP